MAFAARASLYLNYIWIVPMILGSDITHRVTAMEPICIDRDTLRTCAGLSLPEAPNADRMQRRRNRDETAPACDPAIRATCRACERAREAGAMFLPCNDRHRIAIRNLTDKDSRPLMP